jgi:murein L,D-transpeptidase YcbB/YkuD
MRGRFLAAVLAVTGGSLLAASVAVWCLGLDAKLDADLLAAAVVVEIPDNPVLDDPSIETAALPSDAEPASSLPDTPPPGFPDAPQAGGADAPDGGEAVAASPVTIDAIRARLKEPASRENAHPDDLAALEAFYAERAGPSLWMTGTGFSAGAQSVIDELRKADEWGLSSDAFVVASAGAARSSAEAQAAAEIELGLAILKYARFAKGGSTTPSALSKIVDQKPALPDPKAVLSEVAAAAAADAYLRALHPKHEQFERLRQALAKARADGAKQADIERLVLNMERWRWMPENLGARYVQLNIPDFTMQIVKDGKPVYTEKIVVGRPAQPTPVFSAELKSIVFNPERTIPLAVVRDDILPKLRSGGGLFGGGGTAILKQHNLKVKHNGRVVAPSKIDWKTVNMRGISFVQAAGPGNYLGKVMFLYPNEHGIFMHDTLKAEQLARAVRAEGHSHPRLANPGKAAALLLAEDQAATAQQVERQIASGNTSTVTLKQPLPVHTTYFTAAADGEGKVTTFDDVYGLDAAMAPALFGKEVKPDAVAAPAKPNPSGGNVAVSTP